MTDTLKPSQSEYDRLSHLYEDATRDLDAYRKVGTLENVQAFKRVYLQSILSDALKRIDDLGGAIVTKPSPGVDVVLKD